ncbi:quinone oxidoreductase family protein [Bradyrhizobium sp. USDA 4452]
MKAKVVIASAAGGPDVLQVVDTQLDALGDHDVLVRQTAIGINFVDIYHRKGVYPIAYPGRLGVEAAGVVEAVGHRVTLVRRGDRVAYSGNVPGSYAEARIVPEATLVRVPDGISDVVAAAVMTRGMTVEYLVRRTYPVAPGETVLFHAAAGGVGLIAGQWLKSLGAVPIGTAGGPEKCAIAASHGFDHVIDYHREDIAARVRELTDGEGVPVVFDSVGKNTFEASLDCLAPCGMFVTFGQSSGVIPPFSPNLLSSKGALYMTRPTLSVYNAKRRDLEASAKALFDLILSGKIRIEVNHRYAFDQIAAAHADIEACRTIGPSVLIA